MKWIDLGRLIGMIILFNVADAVMYAVTNYPMDRRSNFWLAVATTILWAIRDQKGDAA